ncbi:MAG TPA: haloalkane dehalogenase [Mycobacteriales bacterium]|nr:haloalkane dehalogenase [Mycobacteriales bacterium]
MQILRTPDERFADLPGFNYEPRYVEVAAGDGQRLRLGYVEAGPADGPVTVLLHGEPSWSYLYRHMIPVLAAAGHRVIAPDLIGFGRSDKPAALTDYSYAAHEEWLREALFDRLDLRGITLVCQDWGGLLGLRLVAFQPERFARVVAANTGFPDGEHRLPEVWWRFHDFVVRTEDLPVGFLVQGATVTELPPEVVAAYDAPFPDPRFKAGARSFPGLIPQSLDDPGTPRQQQAWARLVGFGKPFLTAFSDSDPITHGGEKILTSLIPGALGQPHTTLVGGGHFLQEDVGPEFARVVVEFCQA